MPLTDEEIASFAHLPQPFDPCDDMVAQEQEGEGSIARGRQVQQAVTTFVGKLPVNIALGVVTGAPGIVFGIGRGVVGAVDKKVQNHRHRSAVVAKQKAKLSLTCLSVQNLLNIRAMAAKTLRNGPVQSTKQSPYVKAYLLMEGVDYYARGYHDRTEAHLGGGTDFFFRPNTTLTLGLPLDEEADTQAEVIRHAAIFLQVKDQADFALAKAVSQRDRNLGTALIPLYPLLAQAKSNVDSSSSHFMNVKLYQGEALTDAQAQPNGGILRLHLSLELPIKT